MPTILTSDLHLSDNQRDAYRFKFVEKTLPALLKEHRAGCLLLLGDLTEEKDRHSAGLVNRVAEALERLAAIAQVTWLLGNHDYLDRSQPFFRAIAALAGVEAITEPVARQSLSTGNCGAWGPVCLLPHTRDWQRDWAKVRFSPKVTYFAHNTFEGAMVESGKLLPGIPLDVFPEGARVFSGDVHVPQRLGPVTYVGAPYTVDFGDSFKPRVLLLDDHGEAKSIRLHGPGKVLLELDSVDALKGAHEGLRTDDMVKVRVRLRAKDYDKWPAIRQQVLKWGAEHGVQVHMVQPTVDAARVNQRIRDPAQTDEDLLEEYCKHRGVDAATQRTGRLLMEEA